mmetsp:Transcript_10292/g.26770  ORF Transcript_10292/g.26770 Transcript_10292/m.26770 type:complete len:205 (+) Transcript_10292:221-835(+)
MLLLWGGRAVGCYPLCRPDAMRRWPDQGRQDHVPMPIARRTDMSMPSGASSTSIETCLSLPLPSKGSVAAAAAAAALAMMPRGATAAHRCGLASVSTAAATSSGAAAARRALRRPRSTGTVRMPAAASPSASRTSISTSRWRVPAKTTSISGHTAAMPARTLPPLTTAAPVPTLIAMTAAHTRFFTPGRGLKTRLYRKVASVLK